MILAKPLEIVESILPIITRCPVDLKEQSVDDIRNVIVDQMTAAMKVQLKEESEARGRKSKDDLLISNREVFEQFIENFGYSAEIFDPLDRDIMANGDVQNVKAAQLIENILEMPSIKNSMIAVPMSDEMAEVLTNQFIREEINCLGQA